MLRNTHVLTLWMTLAAVSGLAVAVEAPATQPASALEPIPGWTAKVDAPGQRPQIRPTLALSVPWRGNAHVSFPSRPSSMLLLADSGFNPSFEVWDLSGPRKKAQIRPKTGIDKPIVSPDGMYLAGIAKTGRNEGCVVEVWSLQAAQPMQPVQRLQVSDKNTWGTDLIGFVGADQIAMVVNDTKTLEVWSAKTGQKASSCPFDKRIDTKHAAMSPGGKYLALYDDSKLKVIDLTGGEAVGESELPKGDREMRAARPWPEALAFSPDGREVAALFSAFDQYRIAVWDFASGQVVGDLMGEDKGHHFYDGPALEWLPEGGGFIAYGVNIIERDNGQIIHQLEAPMGQVPRRIMADNTHVIVMQHDLQKGFAFKAFPLPKDKMDKAMAAIKAGGKLGDEMLPPITKADLSAVQDIGVGSPAGKEIAPDPQLPRKFPAPAIRLKMAPPTGLPQLSPGAARSLPAPTIHSMMFSTPQAGQAALFMTISSPMKRTESLKSWVERYNLAGGFVDAIELAPISMCVDFSPEGKQILTKSGDDRVDVYQLGGGPKGKPIAGWRPYESVNDKAGKQVNFACFVDETHVLTRSIKGELILWELPKCKAIWRVQVQPHQTPALSAGRLYLATSLEEGVGIFDTLKGEMLAKIDDRFGLGDIPTAFSPDGQRLALASEGQGLRVWDLKSGKIVNEFALPKEVAWRRPMQWLGGSHMMMGGQFLVDLERRIVLWNYLSFGGGGAPSPMPDSRYWYIAPADFNRPPSIVATALPHADAQKLAESLKPDDVLIIKPGTKVSLDIYVGKDEDERKRITDALTGQLKQNGMEVADGQTVRLVARVDAGKSETVTYHKFGGGDETVTVTQQISKLLFTVDGKTVWETQSSYGGYAPTMLNLRQGQTAQEAVQGSGPGIALYLGARLPKYVTKSMDEIGIGYSRLTAQGPVRAEPPPKNPTQPQ